MVSSLSVAPRYPVDLDSIARHMCPGFSTPPLLAEFGVWLRAQAWGSVGCFDLRGERFPDGYVEGGADLAPHLGLFLHMPDGSFLGFWRPKGNEATPSIVLIGSEGELAVVARALEELLFAMAVGVVSRRLLEDLLPSDEVPAAKSALRDWLGQREVKAPSPSRLAAPLKAETRAFKQWLSAHGRKAARALAKSAAAKELRAILIKDLPPHAEPWETTGIEVVFGPKGRAALRKWPPFTAKGTPRAPFTAARETALLRLASELRQHDAALTPERGPALSLRVQVSSERLTVARNYLDAPDPWHGMSKKVLARGVSEHPRSAYWTPTWATPSR